MPWIEHTQNEMKPPTQTPPTAPSNAVKFGTIAESAGQRIVIYGPGGIGKTTLGARLPGKTAIFDIEESLPVLRKQLETKGLTANLFPVPVKDFQEIRTSLQAPGWDGINNIILDSGTKAEEWCAAFTLATVPHEKGHYVKRIEDYGFGKGYQFIFDNFLPLLGDLDKHCRAGRNVLIICHDCTTNVPNPEGEDWLRYEPRLQSPASGKGSIRLRMKEWSDHTLFLGYDVAVGKDGKGKGSGTRTIYTAEMPHCMAKSRTTQEAIPVTDDADVWAQILK